MRHLSDGERDLLAEQRADEIDAARDTKSEEIERAARDLLEWADLILSEQYETPDEVPEIARMRAALYGARGENRRGSRDPAELERE